MRVPVPPKGEWEAVGYGSGGATYAHQIEERARQSLVRMALKGIADAMGDVDAFIAQYDPATRKVPKIAAQIAVRLLAAGRAGDALGFLERAEFRDRAWVPEEWQAAPAWWYFTPAARAWSLVDGHCIPTAGFERKHQQTSAPVPAQWLRPWP